VKALRLLALDVAVVAAGLFVYDRFVPPPSEAEAPLATRTLARIEEQMEALKRRRASVPGGQARLLGIRDAVEALDLGLPDEDRERLVRTCEGFHEERLRFWADPANQDLDEDAYAVAYRALLSRYEAQIREIVSDALQQEQVIRRFIGDGRVIRRRIR
jgi:hypothetical protein